MKFDELENRCEEGFTHIKADKDCALSFPMLEMQTHIHNKRQLKATQIKQPHRCLNSKSFLT